MRQLIKAIESMIESGEHTAEEIIGIMEVLKHHLTDQILGDEEEDDLD
jgi:hypothetical protein